MNLNSASPSTKRIGRTLLGLAAGAALLLAPAAATAAVSTDGAGRMIFTGNPGEATQIDLAYYSGAPPAEQWRFITGPPSSPGDFGPGCAAVMGPYQCEGVSAAAGDASVDMGDGNDVAAIGRPPQFDFPASSPINLVLTGGSGDDRLAALPDGGSKTMDGADGSDRISLIPQEIGGPPALTPGTYVLTGGTGNDTLEGAGLLTGPMAVSAIPGGVAETFDGGPGADTIWARAGDDVVAGGEGNDTGISGAAGNDRIDGGPGNDGMAGDNGNDSLVGGPGDDSLYAAEVIPGDLNTVGGEPFVQGADTLSCGDGTDTAVADASDLVPVDCELVGNQETCPVSAHNCAGSVTLSVPQPAGGGGASASKKAKPRRKRLQIGKGGFSVAPGAKENAVAKIAKKGRRYIKRRSKVRARLVIKKRIYRKGGKLSVKTRRLKLTLRRSIG